MKARPTTARLVVTRAVALLLTLVCLATVEQAPATRLYASDAKYDSLVNVTEAENGKDIDITHGQTLQVKLKSIAGTGYAWTLSGDPAPLKLTKTFTQRSKSTPGAVQMSVFQLAANSAGLANVTFVYRRSWEYDVPPAKTFSIRVNVR